AMTTPSLAANLMLPTPGSPAPEDLGAGYYLWRSDRLRIGMGLIGGMNAATDQVPNLDLALALDRNRSPRLADELVREQLFRRSGDLDPTGRSVRLHP